MDSYARQTLTTICVALYSVGALADCAGQMSFRKEHPEQLPLGLFQVIKRECSYQPGAPEDCTKTQYIAIAKGILFGADKNEIAVTTWLSPNPEQEHTYVVGDLRRGKFVNPHEYLIEEDSYGKEWFVVEQGTITDYFFIRSAKETCECAKGNMAGKTHLTLKPIARNTELNRLLHYPADQE